ncbi:LpqB family beta-propeller domain-containing protein, partial [Micromonospora zhanjiangensis]
NRRRTGLAAGTVLLALIAGCGIPDGTEVQVDGPVATPLSGRSGASGAELPTRLSTVDPGQFVVNYLKQAAGETGGAYERARGFIAPEDRELLRVRQGNEVTINIVRIAETVPVAVPDVVTNRSRVTLPVQQVGVLHADGSITPPLPAAPSSYTFTVGQRPSAVPGGREDSGLWLFRPPDTLLMSTDALRRYYRSQTIYWWSGVDRPVLVPDRRYLADVVPVERRATEVLGWLTGGPPDWLTGTVRPLPDGTKVVGNVPQTEDRLEVPLSAPAGSLDDPAELDRLAVQLAWSLPDFHGDIELKIRNQTPTTGDADDFRQQVKPADRAGDPPQRYVVNGGTVRPMTGAEPAPELVNNQQNRNVVAAGATRNQGTFAVALVTTNGSTSRRRLQVGVGLVPVTMSRTSTEAFASMGRPVWLKGTDPAAPVGLVVADGKLRRFDPTAVLTKVAGVPDMTAVGVSFDGRRIAYTAADGGLYVAALSTDGGTLTVGPPRRLAISLRKATAVDWMSEDSLVVAGQGADGQTAVYAVAVDGTEENPLTPPGGKVTQVVGYPNNQVMAEANGAASMGFGQFRRVEPYEVPGAAAGSSLTAPFFLY